MDAREIIKVGMSAERTLVVPPERTVGHFVQGMPMVYATPMMILEMELVSGDAINACLEPGWITVGTEVDIRHLAATPVGATVRTTARVVAVERRVIRFEVEAFDDRRRIGTGRHARGLVAAVSLPPSSSCETRFSGVSKHAPVALMVRDGASASPHHEDRS